MPRLNLMIAACALMALGDVALAQNPPPPPPPPTTTPPPTGRGAQPPAGAAQPGARGGRGGGGRGGGGGGATVMTLSTTAWVDGGVIPEKYSQAGVEVSPPLAWTGAPQGTASFALMVHDADATANTIDGQLLWLLWNIPATTTGLAEGFPQGDKKPDGTRQLSQSGPYYRGPAAPATGPVHHYMFELFALDTVLTIEPDTTGNNSIVSRARTAFMAAIAGHVRGKALLFGLYRRP